VRFGETDAAGIVFYPSFFAWFDAATLELLRIDGAPVRGDDGKPRYPFPVVEASATFIAPLLFDDEIEVVATVAKLGESSLRVEYEVRTPGGKTCARGFEQRVFVELFGGGIRPAPIPPALRAHLEG